MSKRIPVGILAMAALLWSTMALTAPAADAVNPTGKWKIKISSPQGDFDMLLEMKADGEKLTGKITAMDQSTEFKDGTVKDNQVAFKVINEFGGQSITANYKGKIEGDNIKGAVEFDLGGQAASIEFSGTRDKS